MVDKNSNKIKRIYAKLPPFGRNIAASLYSIAASKYKHGDTFKKWLKLLKESERWPDYVMRDWQSRILSEYLEYVVSRVPYYANNKMYSEYLLGNVKWGEIPIIQKSDVRAVRDMFVDQSYSKWKKRYATTGTTGSSLHVHVTKVCYEREYAFRRHYMSVVEEYNDRGVAYFLGNALYPTDKSEPPYWVVDYSCDSVYYSIFHMSRETVGSYVRDMKRRNIKYMKGYPSAIYNVCRLAKDANEELPAVRAVYTASEVLHSYQRSLIEDMLGGEVYEWYGQTETTVNIHECRHHRLHIKEEYGLAEVVDEYGSEVGYGREGRLIGTGWGNTLMPFVKYSTGDRIVLDVNQECECGKNGRVVKRILGRDEDVIRTLDGRIITRLDFVFKPIDSVQESQIVQISKTAVCINVVPEENYNKRDEKRIIEIVKQYIGNDMEVNVNVVESLEIGPGGKTRYVISRI